MLTGRLSDQCMSQRRGASVACSEQGLDKPTRRLSLLLVECADCEGGEGCCFKSELGSDESVVICSLLLLPASVRPHGGQRHKTAAEGTDGGSTPVEASLLDDGTLFQQTNP